MRPLVVLTGQGTSLADRFNLVSRLLAKPAVMEHFVNIVAASRGWGLGGLLVSEIYLFRQLPRLS